MKRRCLVSRARPAVLLLAAMLLLLTVVPSPVLAKQRRARQQGRSKFAAPLHSSGKPMRQETEHTDEDPKRALWLAADAGQVPHLLQELKHHLDQINTPDAATGRTPLMQTLYRGHWRAALVLMSTTGVSFSEGVLHALAHGCTAGAAPPAQLLQMLSEHTADLQPEHVSSRGTTALLHGVEHDCPPEVLRALAPGASSDVVNRPHSVTKQQPLHVAALRGTTHALEALLELGADVDARDSAGATALMMVAATGDVASMSLLLDRGADPELVSLPGHNPVMSDATALLVALAAGRDDAVLRLLGAGASAMRSNAAGIRPICLAVMRAPERVVEAVLAAIPADQRAAELRTPDSSGASAVAIAAVAGRHEVVALLLSHGASADVAVPGPPVWLAAASGRTDVVRVLHQAGAAIHGVVHQAMPVVAAAAASCNIDTLRYVAVDVGEAASLPGAGAMHQAALAGCSTEIAEFLLDHGVAVDEEHADIPGRALLFAIQSGNAALARVLIEAGADITSPVTPPLPAAGEEASSDAASSQPVSLVQAAAASCSGDVLRMLLDVPQLDINEVSHGLLPLHLSLSSRCDPDIILLMLEYGADPMLLHQHDRVNPLHVAAATCADFRVMKAMIEVIEASGNAGADAAQALLAEADPETPLIAAVKSRHLDLVRYLAHHRRVPVNTKLAAGDTALYHAVVNGAADIVTELISAGADVSASSLHDPCLASPMLRAVLAQDQHLVDALVSRQSANSVVVTVPTPDCRETDDPSRKTYSTSLMCVAVGTGNVQFVASLTSLLRLDVNSRDPSGMTPAHVAASNGDTAMLAWLVQRGADLLAGKGLRAETPYQMAKRLGVGKDALQDLGREYVSALLAAGQLPGPSDPELLSLLDEMSVKKSDVMKTLQASRKAMASVRDRSARSDGAAAAEEVSVEEQHAAETGEDHVDVVVIDEDDQD